MSTVPHLTLNNGVQIPQVGFGVFQIPPQDTKDAVLQAFDVGYRHIDTAQSYRNEEGVGEALRESGLERGDVFVTTKLNNGAHAPEAALEAFDRSLERLGTDYVDLFLIHWPLAMLSDFVDTWKTLEDIYSSGRARAIGVSNFQLAHLSRLQAQTTILPAVNQIEVHPYLTQTALTQFGREHGILVEAWSPLGQGAVLGDPTLGRIARSHDRSVAQVTLRWHVQRGHVVFPKSVTRARVEDNFHIFDFELTDVDLADIDGLNRDERTGPDPDTFDRVPPA
ncbi:aldo/keto reductase [Cellulomonas sp. URHE0023]|uniref:aldo/keto reductase n=1 Tax=Cellulomonas sp. URHE0023 TaxID=1380354 RepID=UPI000480A750|nr:aldo/keto reductase [Cellulomonas sp. URHE0023]